MSTNKALQTSDIYTAIMNDSCLHYARSDIKSLLDFNGKNMLEHLEETITRNIRQQNSELALANGRVLKQAITCKAHQILIELSNEWLENVRANEQALFAKLPEIRVTHHG